MAKILGISAFYHDSAAAITIDGRVIAAAQEERFTRIKHTPDFPAHSIAFCLEESGLTIDELDAVVFYEKPFLKFERLLQTYYAFAPKGLLSFLKSMPKWMHEKLFLKKVILDGLAEIMHYDKKKIKLLFSEHHLSHASSSFFTSSFKKSAVLTIDGVGEYCSASISKGEGNNIIILKEMNFPHSIGLLYSSFTYFLGFKVNSGEYKLMGLAPYGNAKAQQTLDYIEKISTVIADIKEDGSIWLNQKYFQYATGLKMIAIHKWEKLFGMNCRLADSEITQQQCNLALAIQTVTEQAILKMAKYALSLAESENLCLAGGVALNCVANGKLLNEKIAKNIYIQPAAGDSGAAIGAAMAIEYMYFNSSRNTEQSLDLMKGAYLGPSYSDKEIISCIRRSKAIHHKFDSYEILTKEVAGKVAEGKIVGWFRGRMEFGPRALGNRSILADARNPEMQSRLNLKIKFREGFRPFAPAVMAEDKELFFNLKQNSPYMLLVAQVNNNRRNNLPEGYDHMKMIDKLRIMRSDIPAVTHLDFSARIQTVDSNTNPEFHALLKAFKEITGYGILINTSFNVRGEPIVCTPYDAYRCFMSTDMDYLVIENFLFCKEEQPDWPNKAKWERKFIAD